MGLPVGRSRHSLVHKEAELSKGLFLNVLPLIVYLEAWRELLSGRLIHHLSSADTRNHLMSITIRIKALWTFQLLLWFFSIGRYFLDMEKISID